MQDWKIFAKFVVLQNIERLSGVIFADYKANPS